MLHRFIKRRRSVLLGGLRFECREVTVATVYLLLSYFGDEIRNIISASKDAKVVDVRQVAVESIRILCKDRDWRVEQVLSTCVDGELLPMWKHHADLAEHVLDLTDMEALREGLDLDRLESGPAPATTDDDPDEVTEQAEGIVRIAREFAVAPHEVMNWPYSSFIAASNVLQHINRMDRRAMKPAGIDLRKDGATIPGLGSFDPRKGL